MADKITMCFEITNTSDKIKDFHLFGYSKHFHSLNFGNDTHIRINAIYNYYRQLLVESAFSPCLIKYIKLVSNNKKNIEQRVTAINEDGFGCEVKASIDFKISEFQIQEDITHRQTNIQLNHNSTLNFKIEPNSVMSVYLYVEKLERVDYIQSHDPTLSQITKLFFRKLFKLK